MHAAADARTMELKRGAVQGPPERVDENLELRRGSPDVPILITCEHAGCEVPPDLRSCM